MTDHDKALRAAVRKLERATAAREAAAEDRNRLIREAVASGRTLRDVGAVVGMTHQAIKFIAHGRNGA